MKKPARASGSLPETDPLYAPGIKWRARKGRDQAYWIPPQKDQRKGYAPKSITLDPSASQEDIAARCRALWHDLETWRETLGEAPTRYTIAWLIDRYLHDDISPYRSVQSDTQANYRQDCAAIKKAIGERRIDPVVADGIRTPRILGDTVMRWHTNFGLPVPLLDDNGKPVIDSEGNAVNVASAPSRARHLIVMLRGLFTYAIMLGVPGAAEQRKVLEVLTFPTPPARTKAPTFQQVDLLVNKAIEKGYRSIAIATLAQYELIERRVHIIGRWDKNTKQWKPGWLWERVTDDWWITYEQRKRGIVKREFDLKTTQRLLGLMQETPKEDRSGPVIICEDTGEPWRKRYYAEKFREIARAAKVPDDIWSMDMRAGGATEADAIPEVSDRALQDAGGWADPKISARYRRNKQRNAQNVVVLRQKSRMK